VSRTQACSQPEIFEGARANCKGAKFFFYSNDNEGIKMFTAYTIKAAGAYRISSIHNGKQARRSGVGGQTVGV